MSDGLERLRKLEADATPAPWRLKFHHREEDHDHLVGPGGEPIGCIDKGEERSEDTAFDAGLLVALRNVAPQIIALIEAVDVFEKAEGQTFMGECEDADALHEAREKLEEALTK